MNQHRRGISFDYVLILDGMTAGEFIGWTVTARMYRDGWDVDSEQQPEVLAEWTDANNVAVHVLCRLVVLAKPQLRGLRLLFLRVLVSIFKPCLLFGNLSPKIRVGGGVNYETTL